MVNRVKGWVSRGRWQWAVTAVLPPSWGRPSRGSWLLAPANRQGQAWQMQPFSRPPFSPCSHEVCFLVWGEVTHDDDRGSWEICGAGIAGKGDTHTHPKGPGIQMVAKEGI